MNNNERELLRYVCDGDMRRAKMQAQCILKTISSQKDAAFRDDMLRRMDADAQKGFIKLPPKLEGLLTVEDSASFPDAKFLLRKTEADAVEKIIALYRAAERLAEMGIPYLPALILYGESGCGKTELARYIAHKAELPFAYVRFSNIVDSHLGETQSNIARIFEYIRSNPCVLCFDEIDAIGMARGQMQEVGEMNRIVIAVMQELDQIPKNAIIIGTTNRFDMLDPALVRRFPLQYELVPLSAGETKELAHKYFRYAGLAPADWIDSWCEKTFEGNVPAATVVRECTDVVVNHILQEQSNRGSMISELDELFPQTPKGLRPLVTDTPDSNEENILNLFYIKGHEVWVRGGGPGPSFPDISLHEYVRQIAKEHNLAIDVELSDDDLSDCMYEALLDGTETVEGIVATLYAAGWAFAELRERLKLFEAAGSDPA